VQHSSSQPEPSKPEPSKPERSRREPSQPEPSRPEPSRGPLVDRPFRFGLWAGLALLLVVLAAIIIKSVATVLTVVAAAGFFAIGLNPVVRWMMRRGLRRGSAVAILFFALALLGCGLLALLIPLAVSQISQVIDHIPGWVDQFLNDPRVQKYASDPELSGKVQDLLTPQNISLVLGGLLGGAATVAAGVVNIVTA
jgi:predicted PurR-regulated permease PerM